MWSVLEVKRKSGRPLGRPFASRAELDFVDLVLQCADGGNSEHARLPRITIDLFVHRLLHLVARDLTAAGDRASLVTGESFFMFHCFSCSVCRQCISRNSVVAIEIDVVERIDHRKCSRIDATAQLSVAAL
jgi:hypothetical protein